MKNLSYREKIGLLVLIVALVIIIFVAWPIKTIRANIKTHEKEKEEVQVVYDEKNRLINQIPTIEKNIKKVYDESKDYSSQFTIHRENFEIDKYVQEIINADNYKGSGKHKVQIERSFTQDDAIAAPLEFYYYTPNVVVYPILEAADTNGNLLEKTDKELNDKLNNALVISSLEAQEVELHTASMDMKFTKEGLMALEDELKEKETGVRIVEVIIKDYSFGSAAEITIDPEDKDYSEGTVVFEFYTMQQIQEPVFN